MSSYCGDSITQEWNSHLLPGGLRVLTAQAIEWETAGGLTVSAQTDLFSTWSLSLPSIMPGVSASWVQFSGEETTCVLQGWGMVAWLLWVRWVCHPSQPSGGSLVVRQLASLYSYLWALNLSDLCWIEFPLFCLLSIFLNGCVIPQPFLSHLLICCPFGLVPFKN